jgi:hypothetical protein
VPGAKYCCLVIAFSFVASASTTIATPVVPNSSSRLRAHRGAAASPATRSTFTYLSWPRLEYLRMWNPQESRSDAESRPVLRGEFYQQLVNSDDESSGARGGAHWYVTLWETGHFNLSGGATIELPFPSQKDKLDYVMILSHSWPSAWVPYLWWTRPWYSSCYE